MWYDGDTIYSYGAHFPIARIITRDDDEQCVLFTTRTYSVSTGTHCRIVRSACSHFLTFNVPFIEGEHHAANMAHYTDMSRHCIEQAKRRRISVLAIGDLEHAQSYCVQASAYAEWFNLDRRMKAYRVPTMPDDLGERINELRARHERELKIQALLRADRNAEIERDIIPRWRAGERVSIPYEYSTGAGVYIMRINGDNVETSGNARFSVEDAVAVWPTLQRLRTLLNGDKAERVASFLDGKQLPKLGFYRIDSVSSLGVRAGCHLVEWPEIDRIAGELGLA
jgi:hypothetical protein